MWTLQFSRKSLHSWILQVVVTQVQLSQTRGLGAENWGQSFTASLWEVTATQSEQEIINKNMVRCWVIVRQYQYFKHSKLFSGSFSHLIILSWIHQPWNNYCVHQKHIYICVCQIHYNCEQINALFTERSGHSVSPEAVSFLYDTNYVGMWFIASLCLNTFGTWSL